MTASRWGSLAILLAFLLIAASSVRAGDETCYPIEVTWYSPSGVAGCTLDGPTDGKASTYPGRHAATNWCTWEARHTIGCGLITVQSLRTGVVITIEPGEFCDCWHGGIGPNGETRRLVDLTPGQVASLGLDIEDGLFDVIVTPVREPLLAPVAPALPDTAVAP